MEKENEKVSYMVKRYAEDPEFRNRLKQFSKDKYKRKTANCSICNKRIKSKESEENDGKCLSCKKDEIYMMREKIEKISSLLKSI